MAHRPRRSLRFRLIAACVVIELVMLTLIVGNSVRLVERHLIDLAQERVHQMEEVFTISLAAPLAARDHAALRSLVQRLAALEGLTYLVLVDEEGLSLATGGGAPQPLPSPDVRFSDAAPVHHATSDISLYGQPLGRLHYGLSTHFLTAAKQELLIQGIAIAVLEVCLSTLALVTVGVLLTARLEALTDASRRLAGGDYRALVAVRGNDEVATLSRAFNTMAEAVSEKIEQMEAAGSTLRAANADLQRLAEVTAHHLQEPVRRIANFSQLLSQRARERLDGESLDYLNYLVADAKRTRALLTDLQIYVSIDMTPLLPGMIADLQACAQDAVDELAAAIAGAGAEVAIGPLPSVRGDCDQLTMVLRLLVENAIDHRGPAPPRIALGARTEAGRAMISVSDNGPGVAPEFRERVFDLFESLNPHEGGTGVGLSVVRRIIRRHGGNVWIMPAAEGGLAVCFTLATAAGLPPGGAPSRTSIPRPGAPH